MPSEIFNEGYANCSISKNLFGKITESFGVSLTAAILRYGSLAGYTVSIIMTKNNYVEWNFVNEHFMFAKEPKGRRKPDIEEDGLYFWRKNNYRTFDNSSRIRESEYKQINAREWYGHDSRCGYFDKLKLIDFEMPRYNSTLTVLWED